LWHTTTGRVIPYGALDVERAGVLFQPGIWEFESSKVSHPFVRAARLPKRRENGPEIPAFCANLRWKSPKVSGLVREYSRFAETTVKLMAKGPNLPPRLKTEKQARSQLFGQKDHRSRRLVGELQTFGPRLEIFWRL
jgi:hypothetical protein